MAFSHLSYPQIGDVFAMRRSAEIEKKGRKKPDSHHHHHLDKEFFNGAQFFYDSIFRR